MDVVSRGGIIDVCYCDMFSVVNVYLDHLKFCVVCINSRRYVCCSECNVVSNECFLFVSLANTRVSLEEVCLPSFEVLNCWLNLGG